MSATITPETTQLTGTGLASLYEPLLPHLAALDRFLEDQLLKLEPEIQPLGKYALETTGKRLRSLLLFYSGWNGESPPDDSLVRAAAVIELVHLATLVHDDILDGANLRHQRPTVSQKFGASAAVLFGDALFAHALRLAAEFPTVEICRAVSEATRRVCAGEIKQNFQKGSANLTLQDYFRIIELKTAELFWLSCRLGGYLSGQAEPTLQALEQYGRHLGIAYQIFDDVTDLLGEEQEIGKTLGTDLNNGKFTLPLLLLFQSLSSDRKETLIQTIKEDPGSGSLELLQLFKTHQIMGKTMGYFRNELERSSSALQPVGHLPLAGKLLKINDLIEAEMRRFSP